jgi:hypothetical protein
MREGDHDHRPRPSEDRAGAVFHVELRQFPHNTHAFNLTERELMALAVPWAQERWVELGERRWNPNQARMTVLEGPRLEGADLALGRGWRNAERVSEDVTERVLAQARALAAPADAAQALAGPVSAPEWVEPTGWGALLGPNPDALLRAWQLAAERRPELSPSESLALAEATLRSLDRDPS